MNFKKMKITCSDGKTVVGYDAYLNSDHWRKLRKEIINERGLACERCFDVDKSPHIHHKTYKRLGKEKEEDLTVLCCKCHKIIHDRRKKGRSSSLEHVKKVLLNLEDQELKEIYKYLHDMIY